LTFEVFKIVKLSTDCKIFFHITLTMIMNYWNSKRPIKFQNFQGPILFWRIFQVLEKCKHFSRTITDLWPPWCIWVFSSEILGFS